MRVPEASLVRRTVTFRVMKVPDDPVMPRDSLLRWLCLATGLISENESRDTVVRVLDSFLSWHARGASPTAEEVAEGVPGASEKTVRYHLKRMTDLGLLEKKGRRYSLAGSIEAFFSRTAAEAAAPAAQVFRILMGKYEG